MWAYIYMCVCVQKHLYGQMYVMLCWLGFSIPLLYKLTTNRSLTEYEKGMFWGHRAVYKRTGQTFERWG